jgi:hypothetical protein
MNTKNAAVREGQIWQEVDPRHPRYVQLDLSKLDPGIA